MSTRSDEGEKTRRGSLSEASSKTMLDVKVVEHFLQDFGIRLIVLQPLS